MSLPSRSPTSVWFRHRSGVGLALAAACLAVLPAQAERVDFEPAVYAGGAVGALPSGSGDKPFTGQGGWSVSEGASAGQIGASTTSGDYTGGLAMRGTGTDAYVGAKNGFRPFQQTGSLGLIFDLQFATNAPTTVGFWQDIDADNLFDAGEVLMTFGAVETGSGVEFGYQDAWWPTGHGTGVTGTAGHWYRMVVILGTPDFLGTRSLEIRVRDLTAKAEIDFDAGQAGVQPWRGEVTITQLGYEPSSCNGTAALVTGASAGLDNIGPLTFQKGPNQNINLDTPAAWAAGALPYPTDTVIVDAAMGQFYRNSAIGSTQ